jgi:hypothetical protein
LNFFFWRKKSALRKPIEQRKFASAYLFPDRLVIHSQLHTPYGMFASEPFQGLDRDASPGEIGRCIGVALQSSRSQSDMPMGKEFAKWYLKGMGVKSNAQLQRTALNVGIIQLESNLEFSPTHNGGATGDSKGYFPISGQSPLCIAIDASPAEIGATLLKAFSLCTSVYD